MWTDSPYLSSITKIGVPDKDNSAIPLSSKAWFSSNPITASRQICVWKRAPIDIKILAGRADNELPIYIGSIATLEKKNIKECFENKYTGITWKL